MVLVFTAQTVAVMFKVNTAVVAAPFYLSNPLWVLHNWENTLWSAAI